MKRKAQDEIPDKPNGRTDKKRRSSVDKTAQTGAENHFRSALFEKTVLQEYKSSYATSAPYKHGVIQNLIAPKLLRNVRTEIQENLHFTPKETDIYKIHQSGDLANLDGLDDSSLKLLPSLLTLRDALYSAAFRQYLSTVTGSGPLSGRKTDMAINVYTPGCHLLCHDDVIGSRRVSYILYLTDPDRPWKAEWGGALRLYPTQTYTGDDGEVTKVPSPDFSVSIPPTFNQLSFFAVQPGESFHDVEEVYARKAGEKEEDDGGRVRMAISGWYHIPQEGEDGYEEGLEERLAEKSSLMQLQGKGDKYDLPQPQVQTYEEEIDHIPVVEGNGQEPAKASDENDDSTLTVADLDFLLEYLAPTYLTPDTLSSLSSLFADESSLRLSDILSAKFSSSLRSYITTQEKDQPLDNLSAAEIEASTPWKVARPPHKHRFLFQQPSASSKESAVESTPLNSLLNTLLPSRSFRKWLSLATGLTLTSHDILARRFRRGLDYSLATGYNEDVSRLEVTLGITPTKGWGDDEEEDANEEEEQEDDSAAVAHESKRTEAEDEDAAADEGEEQKEDSAAVANESKKTEADNEDADADEEDKHDDNSAAIATGSKKPEAPNEDADADEEDKHEHDNAPVLNGSKKSRDEDAHADEEENHDDNTAPVANGSKKAEDNAAAAGGTGKIPTAPIAPASPPPAVEEPVGGLASSSSSSSSFTVGGYEVYMAGDDDADSVPIPATLSSSAPGAKSSQSKSDPAIYHSTADDDDDGVLFSMPAGWNRMSVVLRDRGVLRFVKFVSRRAEGGRWDVGGGWGVDEEAGEGDEDGDGEDDEGEEEGNGKGLGVGVGVGVGVGLEDSETEEEEMGSGSDESSD